MQLANGLALQTAKITLTDNQAPLTPVMVLSELSPDSLARRSLAWITEERAATFRAGKTAEHLKGPHIVEDAYQKARSALSEHGVFSQIQQWQRQIKTSALFQQIRQEGDPSGTALIRKVRTLVTAWKTQLQKIFSTREIWPVVFIDPIQRWQEYEKSEVEGLNELVEAIDIAADEEGWIVLVTSDTNKQSAKGEYKQNTESDPMEIGASLFRGSYKLLHCADLACFLDKAEGDPNDVTKYIPLQIFKNRFGPTYGRVHYAWHTPTGRFRPLANKEQQNYLKEQRAALERMLVESKIAQSVRRIEVNEEVKKRTKPKTTDWDD
jgi:hypothetical protein